MTAIVANHYRTFELPWSVSEEEREQFRHLWRTALAAVLLLSLIMPWLPVPERPFDVPPALPPRIARLVLDRAIPPPPPPPPVQEQPQTVATRPQPDARPVPPQETELARTQDARRKASQAGLLPFVDQLADLRDKFDANQHDLKPLASAKGDGSAPRAERALITARTGTLTGGINTAGVSRGFGSGSGTLDGHGTTRMQVPLGGSGVGDALAGGSDVSRSGAGKKASRSQEEIELVFDRNKAAIYALYNRALRENPELLGKVVFELTIAPWGEVTACQIVSSELRDSELERKLIARIRMFRFAEKDVEAMTTTKPIEFFPA